MRLEKTLKACGFNGDPAEFRSFVRRQFQVLFPQDTDEDVLCSPSTKALPLCKAIRQHYRLDFPEAVVLKTLINERKAGRRTE